MFTFVVWVIGLVFLLWLALFDIALTQKAFESSYFWGIVTCILSVIAWAVLLGGIFA